MVGDRLQSLRCIFKCSSVLLLWVSFTDLEALSCQHVIHKKVGDTVEFSSCLPPEGVTTARWKYGRSIIANKGQAVDEKQFKGRLNLSLTDFSLTVENLMLQDSGDYSFHSEANGQQQGTVTVTLKVHESVTAAPELTGNSTWDSSTNTCTVLLDCSSKFAKDVSYKWTVGDQTRNGSRLRHIFTEQDGETTFNCTIYNPVSEMSASKAVTCKHEKQTISPENDPFFLHVSIVAGSALLVLVIITAVVCYCKRSKSADIDAPDQTIYADITEVTTEDKPCSVYETIDNKDNHVTPKPHTVYDQIQLSRVKTTSVSPYQEIS